MKRTVFEKYENGYRVLEDNTKGFGLKGQFALALMNELQRDLVVEDLRKAVEDKKDTNIVLYEYLVEAANALFKLDILSEMLENKGEA